eukprot:COSAG05_NODE_2161_length_3450_cov_41.940931_4_plen_50_part_01
MMRDRRLSLTEATRQIWRSYPRFPKRVGGKGGGGGGGFFFAGAFSLLVPF